MTRTNSTPSVVHTLTGSYLYESAKAARFKVDDISGCPLDEPKTEWFPFSQITKIMRDSKSVGQDTIVVSEWILKQKGMI